jgi:signal transduction histidine kinase
LSTTSPSWSSNAAGEDLKTWGLRRRVTAALLGFAMILAAVVAISGALLVAVRSQQRQVVDRYFSAVRLSNNRFIAQVDAETAVRGYGLTNDQTTLQPLENLRSASYGADAVEVHRLLMGDVTTIAAFQTWDATARRWLSDWVEPTVKEISANPGAGLSSADVLRGKRLFDAIRTAYGHFSDQLVAKRQSANHHLTLLTTLLFAAVIFALVSVLLAGLALWFALRRWILNPLGQLAAETRLVQGGDLEHVVTVDGPRELTAVANDVDEMRRELVDQLAEVERARLELEAAGAALTERAEELARSNRDLEQFAYVASHDLQEPLRKIASFCQLLEQRYQGRLDERADSYIAFAVDGAKRMQQLINDLLAFSRVGRTSAQFVDVDLDRCLDAAVSNLSEVIAEAGAQVVWEPLPTVPGDPALLTQLFQNLIGNSLKFRGADAPRVSVVASRRGAFWELSSVDNGIGIDPQYADRIFVIFQRLHGKDEYAGTGIGLALCKRIVEHHGGTIWLDQQTTGGANFRWTLPMVARSRRTFTNPLPLEAK